jgi:hypothetical protein
MDTNEILKNRTFDSDWDKNNFTRWLSSIADAFKGVDIKVALSDKASLCKMFFTLKNTSVNRQKYQQVKKDIQALQEYYGIETSIPTREEVLEFQEVTVLYKDLPSLLGIIDKAGRSMLENYDPEQDLLNIKALVILGWSGIPQDAVVQIKTQDISRKADCYQITTNKGDFSITESDYEVLNRLSTLSEYRGFPTGKPVVLKGNTDYLFRAGNFKSAGDAMPVNSITKLLEKFSSALRDKGYAIVYRYLRKNALFVELYEELRSIKEPISLAEQIQKKFNCEYHTALGYKTEYNLWKAKYHDSK